MGDNEEASPEAKLNIATYFIMNSPPGEVHDVVTDVTKLLNDPQTLTEAALTKIMRDYNTEQFLIANDPEGVPLLVTAYGQVDGDSYLDPNTGRILKFDHRKQKFTEVTDKKQVLDDSIAKYRTQTAKLVDTYIEQNFKTGKCVSAVYGSDNGKLTVCISARNVNLSNFWTGGWRSTYSLMVGSTGDTELKGNIKINVHYFEDGNVQLHTTMDKTHKVNVTSDADATAQEIQKAIGKIESDFQALLEEMYVNMHHKTFKAMRRYYSVTRTPMIWNSSAHTLTTEMNKSENMKN